MSWGHESERSGINPFSKLRRRHGTARRPNSGDWTQMISSARRKSVGWLTLAIPPLLWAGNIGVGRAASAQVPPMMLALSRHLIALAMLLPIGWPVMRRDLNSYWQHRWPLVRLFISGMVCFNALVYLGLHYTTASNAQMLNSAIPVLIIVFSALFPGQRLTILQTIGLLVSCSGVLTIIFHGDWARFLSIEFARGGAIIFAVMASFAPFSIWLQSFPAEIDRLGLLGAQFGIAVAVLTPLVIIEYRLRLSRTLGSRKHRCDDIRQHRRRTDG